MKKTILTVGVVTLFICMIFASVGASLEPNRLENDEDPGSILVTFETNRGEEYPGKGEFKCRLILGMPGSSYYNPWVEIGLGNSSALIENLPMGLYKLDQFRFSAGYIRIFPVFVFVGNGRFMPSHKEITVKIIDTSSP